MFTEKESKSLAIVIGLSLFALGAVAWFLLGVIIPIFRMTQPLPPSQPSHPPSVVIKNVPSITVGTTTFLFLDGDSFNTLSNKYSNGFKLIPEVLIYE